MLLMALALGSVFVLRVATTIMAYGFLIGVVVMQIFMQLMISAVWTGAYPTYGESSPEMLRRI
jgi:hypothetical protein